MPFSFFMGKIVIFAKSKFKKNLKIYLCLIIKER